ncbi:hypothetical protein AK830_g10085 [Neonectria ditissima]|uniref:Uncharacterized protein n=1 Tax=Neonectria ditissima TaxID=78410 RepID=A0A0N8H5L1_9HYPO|nr:hypothetical protein AK830_g10085 [Neonectria ditissima]
MGLSSWLDSVLGLFGTPQRARGSESPRRSLHRPRYSSQPRQAQPRYSTSSQPRHSSSQSRQARSKTRTPTETIRTGSDRSHRRRPRRPSPLHHHSDTSECSEHHHHPRPITPRPSCEPYRHLEVEHPEKPPEKPPPPPATARRHSPPARRPSHRRHSRHRTSSTRVIPWTDDQRLDRSALREVVHRLSELFDHIPYVVSGLSAMQYYGFDGRTTSYLSVICPAHSREAIRGWAKAQGIYSFPEQPDHFGIAMPDGLIRQVRVKYVDEGFEDMDQIRLGRSRASVLSLPGLADRLAQGYVKVLEHSEGRNQTMFAEDIFWVLNRIAELGHKEHWLTPTRAPHIWCDRFWVPFSVSFPDSVPLFGAAGIGLDDLGTSPDWATGGVGVPMGRGRLTPNPRLSLSESNVRALEGSRRPRY